LHLFNSIQYHYLISKSMAAIPVEKAYFKFLTPKWKHGHQPHYTRI